MRDNVTIVAVEQDSNDFSAVTKGLQRAGVTNVVRHFEHVDQANAFFDSVGNADGVQPGQPYLLLLDTNGSDGEAVSLVKKVKESKSLKRMPVLILSQSDSQDDATKWHMLGCSVYVSKPKDQSDLIDAIHKLGLFLGTVEIPQLGAAG